MRFGFAVIGVCTLSRSCSEAFTLAGWLRPGMPVRKIATRSLRGAAGTNRQQVECRAEVDEEGIVALPGENLLPAGTLADRLGRERVVVGRGLRSDVVRGHDASRCNIGTRAV